MIVPMNQLETMNLSAGNKRLSGAAKVVIRSTGLVVIEFRKRDLSQFRRVFV